MTSRIPKLTGMAAAAWLALIAWWVPASAQDASPLDATRPPAELGGGEAQPDNSPSAEGESSFPHTAQDDPDSDPICARPGCASCSLPRSPAFPETSPNPPEEKRTEKKRPISYGLEIGLRSGHADRGFVISDRPVVQSEAWVSGSVVSFSVWSNLTLAETTDGSRPQILEMELTSEHQWHQWKTLTIKPAIRMFSYRDPLNRDSTRSIEGWLYLSYDAGPFRLFTNHSFDALSYRGAYFGEAGIEFERGMSQTVKIGGSFSTGWASSTFNDAYAGFDKSALNRISVEGWLKRYVKPHLYIGPQFEFSNILDRALRAKLPQPTFFFVGLTTGVEF